MKADMPKFHSAFHYLVASSKKKNKNKQTNKKNPMLLGESNWV
jgi:hypothetical protein